MGMMGREAAVAIIETLDLPIKPEEYMSESQQIMSKMFPTCTFLPGQPSRNSLIFFYFWLYDRNISTDIPLFYVIPSVGRTATVQGLNFTFVLLFFFCLFFLLLFSHEAEAVVSMLIVKVFQNPVVCELFLSCPPGS